MKDKQVEYAETETNSMIIRSFCIYWRFESHTCLQYCVVAAESLLNILKIACAGVRHSKGAITYNIIVFCYLSIE